MRTRQEYARLYKIYCEKKRLFDDMHICHNRLLQVPDKLLISLNGILVTVAKARLADAANALSSYE